MNTCRPVLGLSLLLILCASASCMAAPALPPYVSFPAQANPNQDSLTFEDYGEVEFQMKGQSEPVVQRGHHWSIRMTASGFSDGSLVGAIWARFKPAFLASGWNTAAEFDSNPYTATLHYMKNGKDAWLSLDIYNSDDIRMELIEIAPPTLKLTLKPPAATPEKITAASGDFPYLTPLPGSSGGAGELEDGPMLVATGQDTNELQAVGSGDYKKNYSLPSGLSTVLFAVTYRDALKQAGWTIVQLKQGLNQADATITAHYAANGRDIWAYLHMGGDGYSIQVADAGAQDFGKDLDRDCHVALYGIHFDFNKATLRPDSEPTLEKVLSLLKSRPDLKLEVQGHTDNVGGDSYNQKLSEARANTVVAWLTGKGVAAGRLTARGYGMKVPIADNGSDEGRAKNRRVELKKQGCGK